MQAYLPQVHEASKALQIALETGLEGVFQKPLQPVLPMFIPLWNKTQAANGASGSAVTANPRLKHLMGDSAKAANRKPVDHPKIGAVREPDSGRKYCEDLKRARNLEGYWQTSANTDGQGLRPSLFWHRLQSYGPQTKSELLSLSFYDLTPNPHTETFGNKLIAHFEAELPQNGNGGTELMLYEFYA
jgi:hypothetical protein